MNDSKFQTWEEAVSWLISQPEKQELIKACYKYSNIIFMALLGLRDKHN
jgi:hypothetical protein